METTIEYDTIDRMVKQVFQVEDLTLGTLQQDFIVRYRGRLTIEDSAGAYDQLTAKLEPMSLVPLFREEDKKHIILIQKSIPTKRMAKPWVNLLLFILTVISVLIAYGLSNIEKMPSSPLQAIGLILQTSWPYAVSLLGILGVHEFGHYLAGRAHGEKVTLPFFIPMPFTSLGTMGAFINMKEAPKNRRVLMDIAVAGPLAGYIVSLVVVMIGLSLSHLDRIPTVLAAGQGFQIEGNSITYLLLKYLRFGQLLPQPLDYDGLNSILYWLKYFFTGKPFPLGGLDVMIHPVAWAGWVGLLVTSLNLIPAGQLDGGHVFYLLFGKKTAKKVLPVIIVILAGMGFLWSGWWLWAGLIFFFGQFYAEPRDQITQLDRPRKILGIITLILFFLTFTPIPLTIMMA